MRDSSSLLSTDKVAREPMLQLFPFSVTYMSQGKVTRGPGDSECFWVWETTIAPSNGHKTDLHYHHQTGSAFS